jgi:hypothetical protein
MESREGEADGACADYGYIQGFGWRHDWGLGVKLFAPTLVVGTKSLNFY